MKKQEVADLIRDMPDEIDVEELMYRLYLKGKIQQSEAELAAGKGIPHEEVVRITESWRK